MRTLQRIALAFSLAAIAAGALNASGAPTAVSVTTKSGALSGHYDTFNFTWSDPVAQSNIGHLQIMFNNNLSTSSSCWVLADRGNIYFHDDSGNQMAGVPFGSGTLLQNSQCAIYPWQSSLTPSNAPGTTATLQLAVVFFPAYAGSQQIWMTASNGASSPWTPMSPTYTVTEHAPTVNLTSMPAGPAWQGPFNFSYTFPDAAIDMGDAQVMISNGSDPYWYCFAVINSSGWIYLSDDNGNIMPPVQAGASGTHVGNRRCSMAGSGSSLQPASGSTTKLNLTLATAFTSNYAGARSVSTMAVDVSLITSGWFTEGAYTVGGSGAPLTITTASSLPGAVQGSAYSTTLAASGGTPPYAWSVEPGYSLPAGLTLSAAGALTGTPTAAGAYTLGIQLMDSAGAFAAIQPTLTISTVPTYSIGGQVTLGGAGMSGVIVTLAGGPGGSITTPASGSYSFTGLPAGGYTVTPSKAGYTFSGNGAVTVINSSVPNVNFTAALLPDFSLTLTANQAATLAGTPATYTVTVTPSNGFSGTVTFQAAGLPPGASATFNPISVTGSGATTMTVQTLLNGVTGNYGITAVGSSGATNHVSTPTTLAVQDFTVTLTPSNSTIGYGISLPLTASVTGINGYTGNVNLMVTEIYYPQCCSNDMRLQPYNQSIPANNQTIITLTNNDPNYAVADDFGFQLQAYVGNVRHYATTDIWTGGGGDFSVSAPSPQTTTASGTATYQIPVAAQNGFNGMVTFSVSGLPSGVTSNFPTSVDISGSASIALTLHVPAGISPQNYPFTIGATTYPAVPSIIHNTTTWLNLQSGPSFNVSAIASPIVATNSAPVQVAIDAVNGGVGTVGMTATSIPSGMSVSGLAPNGVGASTTFTVTAAAGVADGDNYQLTIQVCPDSPPPGSSCQNVTTHVPVHRHSISISPTTLPSGQQNAPYQQTLTATGGVQPYTWSIVSGSLPPGLALQSNQQIATITGTPTTGGSYSFTVQVADSSAPTLSGSRTLAIAVSAITISPSSLPTGFASAPYRQSLTATGGAPPYTWSATATPSGLTLSSNGLLSGTPPSTGSYTLTVTATDSAGGVATQTYSLTVQQAPTGLALPTGLKGVNYYPQNHAFWNMLNDWNSSVSSQVAQDFITLTKGGVNFIHIYIWDQDIVQDGLPPSAAPVGCGVAGGPLIVTGSQQVSLCPGFTGWDDGGPTPAQLIALEAFVNLAEQNKISVHITFAINRVVKEQGLFPDPTKLGDLYGNWVSTIVDYLTSSDPARNGHNHRNVLVWGLNWGNHIYAPSPCTPAGCPNDYWGMFWNTAYADVLQTLNRDANTGQSGNTFPQGRALLALEAHFKGNNRPDWNTTSNRYDEGPSISNTIPRGNGYQWTWQLAQQEAFYYRSWLPPSSPDLWEFEMYNANASDFEANLNCLTGNSNAACIDLATGSQGTPVNTCGAGATSGDGGPCYPIPFTQMIPIEFATSSSIESQQSTIGNGWASNGDAQTPTSTAAGQAQWTTDTMCVFSRNGIPTVGYFGFYDAVSFWQDWDLDPLSLAWRNYWGLASESTAGAYKPAWTSMTGFKPTSCGTQSNPTLPTPIVAIQSFPSLFVSGDVATLTYTAGNNTAALTPSVSGPGGSTLSFSSDGSYSCGFANGTYSTVSGSSLAGSCSFTHLTLDGTLPASITFTLSASSTVIASVTVPVGPAPAVSSATQDTSSNTLTVSGSGFSGTGGDSIRLTNPNYADVWLYEYNPAYQGCSMCFVDNSTSQITAKLANLNLPKGTTRWNLYVQNPASANLSTAVTVTIQQ